MYSPPGAKGYEIKSDAPVPAGEHTLEFKFDYDGNGVGKGKCLLAHLYVSL